MQRHLGRGLGRNTELLCPLLDESGCMTVMVHSCVHLLRRSTELQCPGFLLRLHCTGKTDEVID